MKKGIRNIVIILYAIVAILVTICLLSYNEYKVTTFGSYSLVIIDNNKLNPDYDKGDLVIVDGSEKIEIGDKIFFYKPNEGAMTISLAEVTNKQETTETETTYTLEGEKALSSSYVIGSSKDVKKIGTVGTILGILESKWGFLILVVLPALLAFLHEIFEVIAEMRGSRRVDNENRQRQQ